MLIPLDRERVCIFDDEDNYFQDTSPVPHGTIGGDNG